MKDKASISHDEAMKRQLRANPDLAAEYLKAALEDTEEPRVLHLALRHVAAAGLTVDLSPLATGLPLLKTKN